MEKANSSLPEGFFFFDVVVVVSIFLSVGLLNLLISYWLNFGGLDISRHSLIFF